MTVREWLAENLRLMSKDENIYKVYRRIIAAEQSVRMYAGPVSEVLDRDVKRYLDEGE